MDLYFEPTMGKPFEIEVGYFDTVLEIKEKIEKAQGIPVSIQTLIFNGQPLPDELNVHDSTILHRSTLQLLLQCTEPQNQQRSDTIILMVKMPSSKIDLEIDSDDTIRRIKERIHEIEAIPVNRLVIRWNNHELMDERFVRDYEIGEGAEIEVGVRALPATSSSASIGSDSFGGGGGGRKMRVVVVLTKSGTRNILVEVNASDSVGGLRKDLEWLEQRLGFQLPAEGYFFIYKQNVMEENRSFGWHRVAHGDTIEIFNGRVSGGS